MTTASRFRVLGINQDRTFCECCGKQGLNSVVWIEDTESGSIKHFGQVCATKPAKGFDCTKEIKAAISQVKYWIKELTGRRLMREYREAGGSYEGTLQDGLTPTNRELFDQLKAAMIAKAYELANK
jgi:hypothetical protein